MGSGPRAAVRSEAPALHDAERPEQVRTAAALADWAPEPLVDPALLDDPRLRFWTTCCAGTPGAEQLGFVPVIRHTLWHRTRRSSS
ncbi:MAG: hypothetical protein L0H84_06855 [Pseudonocardia sp.]|nr:hypothetical protein [Pseudonocardia sp.]